MVEYPGTRGFYLQVRLPMDMGKHFQKNDGYPVPVFATRAMPYSYYVVHGSGGSLEVEIWESMEWALRVMVWELKSIY